MTILEFLGSAVGHTAVGGYANAGLQGVSGALDALNRTVKNEGLNNLLGKLSSGITPLGAIGYWDDIIKSSKDVNQQLGIAGNYSAVLEQNTLDAYTNTAGLGVEIDDITKSYKELISAYGRTIGLTTGDLMKLGEFHSLFQDSYSEVGDYFLQLGVGGATYVDHLENAMRESLKIGVVSKKTLDTMRSNMGMLDRYSFKKGTKALSEMALFAERTRISMESAGKASDMFRSLDTGVEALAKMQMLGGDFSQQFGNIFELTFEARNSPEALQKRLFKITEGLASINKATGEINIDPYQFDRARAAAEALNIDVQELVQAARVAAKEKGIENLFSVNVRARKDFEEISQMVAGMTEFKDGEWKVRIGNEIKTIAQIDNKDIEAIQVFNKSEGDLMKDILMSNKTLTDSLNILTNVLLRNLIPKNLYEYMDDNLKKVFQDSDRELLKTAFMQSTKTILEAAHGTVAENFIGKDVSMNKGLGENLGAMGSQAWRNLTDIPGQFQTFMGNLDSAQRSNIEQMGFMGFDKSDINKFKTDAQSFFDSGNKFFERANDIIYMLNPFDWSRGVDDMGWFRELGHSIAPNWIDAKSEEKTVPMDKFKTETEKFKNKLTGNDLLNYYTTNSGTVEFQKIEGEITVKMEGGQKLGNIELDGLWKKLKPQIEEKISQNTKFEMEREKNSGTMRSGGGRTRDSKYSGLKTGN